MGEKISVIIPVYNVAAYLNRCVQSIINQTYSNLEILLVDDGSKDQSGSLCDEWEQKDSRIKVFHKENGGLSEARNVGIDHATGQYLCFVDSDDYIHRDMIRVLYDNIHKTESDISMCEFRRVKDQTDMGEITVSEHIDVFEKKEPIDLLYQKVFLNKSTLIVAWNKLYRKELFDEIRYPVGKFHEDEYVIHRILFEAHRLVYTPDAYYCYVQRDNSIMDTFSEKKIWDALDAYEDRINFWKEHGLEDYYRKAVQEWFYKAKKSYNICKKVNPPCGRRMKKEIKKAVRQRLLKIRGECIIVWFRFLRDIVWTFIPEI
jgi:glycosyltransferase involved in cell wall biosynthesis